MEFWMIKFAWVPQTLSRKQSIKKNVESKS